MIINGREFLVDEKCILEIDRENLDPNGEPICVEITKDEYEKLLEDIE